MKGDCIGAFLPGMGWDNIIPISKFNYSSAEDPDFKKCWAL